MLPRPLQPARVLWVQCRGKKSRRTGALALSPCGSYHSIFLGVPTGRTVLGTGTSPSALASRSPCSFFQPFLLLRCSWWAGRGACGPCCPFRILRSPFHVHTAGWSQEPLEASGPMPVCVASLSPSLRGSSALPRDQGVLLFRGEPLSLPVGGPCRAHRQRCVATSAADITRSPCTLLRLLVSWWGCPAAASVLRG